MIFELELEHLPKHSLGDKLLEFMLNVRHSICLEENVRPRQQHSALKVADQAVGVDVVGDLLLLCEPAGLGELVEPEVVAIVVAKGHHDAVSGRPLPDDVFVLE